MTQRGASLKKLADAVAPLYKSLDEGQKHRFVMLAHRIPPGTWIAVAEVQCCRHVYQSLATRWPGERGEVVSADRSLTARSVIASLLLGMRDPALPVSALVRSGGRLGLAEGTIRVAVSRMVAAGEIELREKVEAAGMPEEVKTRAIKEVDRMSRIGFDGPPRPGPAGRREGRD